MLDEADVVLEPEGSVVLVDGEAEDVGDGLAVLLEQVVLAGDHPEAAGALALAAVGGGDGVVPGVGDGAAEVEAKVVLEGVEKGGSVIIGQTGQCIFLLNEFNQRLSHSHHSKISVIFPWLYLISFSMYLEGELVGPAARHDLLAADDLAVLLPDGVVEGVAHHEAGPLGGPDLAEGGGDQAEHEHGCQAEHLEGESEGGRKFKLRFCSTFYSITFCKGLRRAPPSNPLFKVQHLFALSAVTIRVGWVSCWVKMEYIRGN